MHIVHFSSTVCAVFIEVQSHEIHRPGQKVALSDNLTDITSRYSISLYNQMYPMSLFINCCRVAPLKAMCLWLYCIIYW